jgi:hypothetical protein
MTSHFDWMTSHFDWENQNPDIQLIKQYQVTYDSNHQMFVVHRDLEGKPDMEFWMHKSGLHYFDPRDSEFTFINTISKNMTGFMKRQIKDAETTRSLYSKLNYPSWKDFK